MTKIIHLSDIHWRGLTRHAEFTRAFEMFFEKARKIKPDIIFVGGDLFHTKTSGISPEVIDRLAWMLREMGSICPTHIILGNHDGNLANGDRQDAISPIIGAIDSPNIFLYKTSGNFDVGRVGLKTLNLCVYSCFDKPGWDSVDKVDGEVNVATFHGSVGGTKMDNGWIMPDSKAEVKLDMFDGYDFVFLGDIHKRQFLAERPDKNGVMKPYVAYPGSTIQQNFGEDIVKGFLVWDIRAKDDWDVQFVEIENLQPFVSFHAKDTAEGTIQALERQGMLGEGYRYNITSKMPLNPLVERQLLHELKVVRKAEQVIFSADKRMSYDAITHNGVSVKKSNLRNDKSILAGLYQQFLNNNPKKFLLSDLQMEEGKKIIDGYMDKLNSSETEVVRDVSWSIKSFEFDNLFRYGEGNKIDFEALSGVVGVFGKNKIGKSSLVGALMYALFNTSDRDGVTMNGQIMNQNKKTCSAKVVVEVNGEDYVIERSSVRVEATKRNKKANQEFDGDKTETKLNFYKLNKDGTKEEKNGISRDETDKAIRKLLGNPQDFLMTSVATQSRMEKFIDEGPSARKTILNRFLDLEVFEKLHVFAKEDLSNLNAKMATYSMGWDKAITDIKNSIFSKETELSSLELKIVEDREKLDSLRLWLSQNGSANSTDANANLIKVQQKLFSLKRQLSKAEQDQGLIQSNLLRLNSRLNTLLDEQTKSDLMALQSGLDKMKVVERKLEDTSYLLRLEDRALQTQEKSVRKLELVPCGDQFPTCLYIKDSHNDKRSIEAKRAEVAAISLALKEITSELKKYQDERYAERLNAYFGIEQEIKETTREKESQSAQLLMIEKSMKDINNWLKLAQQEETKLADIVAEIGDTSSFELKRKEFKELESSVNLSERRKSDLFIKLGRDNATLEQILKDQTESALLLQRYKILESVQAAFHKNGIPAIVLKTQLPAINTELANLLSGLVDFNIVFDTEPGSNVMDVFIEDGHSKRILELGSGMEKMIASIAIRVALINLSSLPKSDIIVIDEGFNALDEEHVGKCLELLQTMKGFFKNVLVISHMQRVKEASDTIIEVITSGTDSRIEA